jgi:hypothetical protein
MTQLLIGIGLLLIAAAGYYIFHREDKPSKKV